MTLPAAEGLCILIVDDDQVDRLAVRRLLRQGVAGVGVQECGDPVAAAALVRTVRFDCIILDYYLPGTDGVSALRDLRAAGYAGPVVALTGQGDQQVAVELMKAGAADYLSKNGLTAERLERSLRYALALHRAEQDRRMLLEREQQARLQAQAANRAKDEFLATLSHELRTPLNAILGWARLLASGHLDEAGERRALEIIERNTRLQAQLIEDLLDISRIITGKLRLEFRTVALRTILESALEAVRPAAEAKRITLEAGAEGGTDAIRCDPARMEQVLWNLLSNAIKFTPDGGRVVISAARSHDVVVLAVSDTGRGIAPSFLPYVFDRFRQQDAATTRTHGGLGIGLSIVRHLVELHGGTVQAQSDGEGLGATFLVRVPAAHDCVTDQGTRAKDADDEPADLPSLQGVRVLVVDDEIDARGLVAAILQGCGAVVKCADSVPAALQEIARDPPDVLLSDIAMPGEDGYALIRKVRMLERPWRSIPAAALTAFATADDRARALLAGYQAHLPKPVQANELSAVVATLARRALAGA